MYLGPRRAFDDEDLEYLSKEVEDQGPKSGPEEKRPQSPLIVDSISGTYSSQKDVKPFSNMKN